MRFKKVPNTKTHRRRCVSGFNTLEELKYYNLERARFFERYSTVRQTKRIPITIS